MAGSLMKCSYRALTSVRLAPTTFNHRATGLSVVWKYPAIRMNHSSSDVNNAQPRQLSTETLSANVGRSGGDFAPKSEDTGRFPPLVLPKRVKYVARYTTPQMSGAQVEQYLYPLWQRGWRPLWSSKLDEGIDPGGQPERCEYPYIEATFTFKDGPAAQKGMEILENLTETEKHHAEHKLVDKETPALHLKMHTHSARIFPPGGSNDDVYPNITLRDVRLAVLFENSVEEHRLLVDGKDRRPESEPEGILPWEYVLERIPDEPWRLGQEGREGVL